MPEFANLLERFVWSVKMMRDYQSLITPGAPAAIRAEAKRWEKEVDALVELHLLPELPEPPAAEDAK